MGTSIFDDDAQLAEHLAEAEAGLAGGDLISEVLSEDRGLGQWLGLMSRRQRGKYLEVFETLGLPALGVGAGDRLASWLISLRGWRLFGAIMGAILAAFVPALLSWWEGGLINPDLNRDLASDIGYWNMFCIGTPAVLLMISGYFGRLPQVLLELAASGAFMLTRRDWADFHARAERIMKGRVIVLSPWIFGLSLTVHALLYWVLQADNTWHRFGGQSASAAGIAHLALVFFSYYIIALLIVRIISVFLVLREYFSLRVNIQPLHPDKCGGLSHLGSLSHGLNLGTFVMGAVVAVGIYSNIAVGNPPLHFNNVFMSVAYILAAGVIFFLPLFAAHRRMREARFLALQEINMKFESANQQVRAELRETDAIDAEKIEQLNVLRSLYDIATEMPIFPFNISTITSFAGSILVPILFLLIEMLLGGALSGLLGF